MAHVLLDLHEDLERYPYITEILAKSSTNFWIVGRRHEERRLYVVAAKRDATLLEVEEDVKRLMALYFSLRMEIFSTHGACGGIHYSIPNRLIHFNLFFDSS